MYINSVSGCSANNFSINKSKTHLIVYLPQVPVWNHVCNIYILTWIEREQIKFHRLD